MRCDGNAAGMCARAEMVQALEMYDNAIAALRAARSSLATLQVGHTRCERCKWGGFDGYREATDSADHDQAVCECGACENARAAADWKG
jgi:hypothetical protein